MWGEGGVDDCVEGSWVFGGLGGEGEEDGGGVGVCGGGRDRGKGGWGVGSMGIVDFGMGGIGSGYVVDE